MEESPNEINAISASKTEPLTKDKDTLLCDEVPLELRPYMTTSKKPLKTIKITHLNTLADLIGNVDMNRRPIRHDLHPEIIFHSPYCPLPPQVSRHAQIDPRCLSPCFKGKPEMQYSHEEHSSEYSYCQNPECKHEKAFCRVYDNHGRPIPFDQMCPGHPCYLVVPQTPESKITNSVMQNSTPEGAYTNAIKQESPEMEEQHECRHEAIGDRSTGPSAEKHMRTRSKARNLVRLKTKPNESSFKLEAKRKRKVSTDNMV